MSTGHRELERIGGGVPNSPWILFLESLPDKENIDDTESSSKKSFASIFPILDFQNAGGHAFLDW